MAEKFGIPHVFTDYEEMLKLPELDVVSVCTPPFAHKDAAVAALQAGKHVLCEKPMALDATEAQAMVDAWYSPAPPTATPSPSASRAASGARRRS